MSAGWLRVVGAVTMLAGLLVEPAWVAAAVANPDAVAVLVGVETYTKPGVPAVAYAHEDVAAVKRWLIEAKGFDPANIIELADPTKGRLEAVLGNKDSHEGQLFNWLRPGGRSDVFVYYSGHGVPAPEGASGRSYLLPADGDPDLARLTAYPLDVLYANLAKLGARSATLVLETCFSGESAAGVLLPAASGLAYMPPLLPAPTAGLTVIRAAGRDQMASWDEAARLGLLTSGFLTAVAGAADRPEHGGDGDGQVTLAETGRYLEEEVGYQARRRFGRRQRPEVDGDPGVVLANLPTVGVIAAPAPDTPPAAPPEPPVGGSGAEVERRLGLSRDNWRQIQRALAAVGHGSGPADGIPGQRTREAVATWQRSRGSDSTGFLGQGDKDALMAEAAPRLVVAECDRLAASPSDPTAVAAGVEFDAMDGPAAVAACAAATTQEPRLVRLQFQYGRAFQGAGKMAEAVAWYRKAAEQGHAGAQNNLGSMYNGGRGVAKDPTEGARWHRKAAEQGLAMAQHNLGLDYRDGAGVPKDAVEAVRWFRKAAEQGHAPAQADLGWMHESGRGVAQDAAEAVRWYRKAAEQGYARAQTNLGFMYDEGTGMPKDAAEAVRWYRRAAEQGYARAQTNLGFMYDEGTGVPKDAAEAVRWYRKAADQGNAWGQNNLGVMYREGTGVAKDKAEAARWFRRAAEQGNEKAKENLRRLGAS